MPQPGYAQIGTNSIVAGIAAQAAEEVDAEIADAIRNDLVRVSADLFSLNVARGRDLGLGTLNQVRQSLLDSRDPYVVDSIKRSDVDLSPYTSWEDFQSRNNLSDATIAKFRAAYPDLVLTDAQQIADFQLYNPGVQLVNGNTVQGIDRLDLWVGGIAESHVNDGVVGGTFWVIIHEQLDRLQEADRFYYFDRVKDFDFYEAVKDIGFAGIVARTTGMAYTDNIFTVVQPPPAVSPDPIDPVEEPIDELAPTVAAFMPGVGTVDVAVDSPVSVRFSEAVMAGIGLLELRLGSVTGALVESFDAELSPRLLFSGDTLTLDLSAELHPGQTYVLLIPVGAVMDLSGNDYEGTASFEFSTLGVVHQTGTSGRDELTGGVWDDHFEGLAGNDRLVGHAGNDTLDGGAGNDTMVGGLGDDVYRVDSASDVVIELARQGNDTIETTLNSYSLAPNARVNIENLRFVGLGNFNGTGNALDNLINGGTGNDTLNGGSGADTMVGGAGNDSYTVDNAGDVVVEADGAGTDTVNASVSYTLGDFVENLTLTGNGNINGTGNGQANTITGNGAANVLSGGAGNDTLSGGGGNDRLTGGLGADRMTGGTGNDVFVYTAIAESGVSEGTRDLITDFTRGQDRIDLSGISNDFSFIGTAAFTGTNQLRYSTSGGQTVIEANTTGNTNADFSIALGAVFNTLSAADFVGAQEMSPIAPSKTINGNNSANKINGTANAETINGLGGNDVLNGMAGNDTIDGGAGNDVINGGLGADVLTGGAGNDTFVFNTTLGNGNVDVINDFSNAKGNNDVFHLENSGAGLFNALSRGSLSASAFNVGAQATSASHRVVYDQTTGDLYYDADGAGGAAQVLFATLSNRASLTHQDFVVI